MKKQRGKKMKKKRIMMLFGVAIIALLMVSSANAININKIKNNNEALENKNSTNDNEIYVDPNIKLTKNLLPKLKQAYEKIEDPGYKELTKRIIQKIETQEIVKENDLKEILIELNMQNTEIYAGKITGSAKWASAAISIPFLILPISQGSTVFWLGPAPFLSWNAAMMGPPYTNEHIDFTIGIQGKHITEEHSGFALLFLGIWSSSTFIDMVQGSLGMSCFIAGWSPFILITYD